MKFIKVTDNEKVYADGVHDDTKALQECIDSVKDGVQSIFLTEHTLFLQRLYFIRIRHPDFLTMP